MKRCVLLILFVICQPYAVRAAYVNQAGETSPFPIQFAMPESKIVAKIPQKDRDFAHIIPGQFDAYIYNLESEYYKGIRGLTML
jgi:hypothetical protein